MRENHVTVNQFKGVNMTDADHTIDDREFAQVQNLMISDTGDLTRRKPLQWFYDHFPAGEGSADQTYMLGTYYNRLFWYNLNSHVASLTRLDTQVGGPVTQTAALTNNPVEAVLFNNTLYLFMGNAVNPTQIMITPSDWTADNPTFTITPNNQALCNYVSRAVVFKDRIFGIQTWSQKSSRVTFSEPATSGGVNTWTPGNYFDVNPGDGDYVVDIIPFQERLFIFKRNSTWVLIGSGPPSTWQGIKLFDNSIGACHRHCVLEFGGLLYVLSPRGLHRTDGVVYDFVGYPLQTQFLDHLVGPPNAAVTPAFTDGSVFIVRVDDQIFVCSGNATTGWWFYNPSQNAWTQAVFGGGFSNPNNFQLLYGVNTRLADGTRKTFFGTSGAAGYNGSRILWFDTRNPNNLTGYSYSDCLGPYYTPTLIPTSFKTKKWDAGAWYKEKRHLGSELEINVPPQPSQARFDFRINWNYNSDGVTGNKWYRSSNFYRGVLAHRVQGMGYVRRVQMQFYSNADVNFEISALDQVYLQKRDMAEVRQ